MKTGVRAFKALMSNVSSSGTRKPPVVPLRRIILIEESNNNISNPPPSPSLRRRRRGFLQLQLHLHLLCRRYYSAQPQEEIISTSTNPSSNAAASSSEDENNDSIFDFDSTHYNNSLLLPTTTTTTTKTTTATVRVVGLHSSSSNDDDDDDDDDETGRRKPIWEEKYRAKVNKAIFGKEEQTPSHSQISTTTILQRKQHQEQEKEKRRRAAAAATTLAKALLEAGLQQPDEDEEDLVVIKEEQQKSLSVGIIGAPNAGKSALTNYMVGTKVAAVSRKTNTTTHEVLGVMTKGNTQICFFDTPGLMLKRGGFPHNDIKVRVESAWSSVDLYDVLIVIFDVHRHLNRRDARVVRLIKQVGSQVNPNQKRVLCLNKVDLVEKKKDLLKVAEEFKDLPGYERYFMISGLKGSGVKDLTQYLTEQAVKRPWDEDPFVMSEEVMKNISLEVVRERLLDHVHQEIPYGIEHRLIDWKELRDGSLRIEQHFITSKMSQRKILVGKNGSKIGRIGIEANEELRSIFKRNVHLILQVRVK